MPDPSDLTDYFNTQLSPDQELQFQTYAKENPRMGNSYDYDARGAWLSGQRPQGDEHGGDTYKKPNHPTFSTFSQYNGQYGFQGGQWTPTDNGKFSFAPGAANTHFQSLDDLKNYWNQVEAPNGHTLLPPIAPQPTQGPVNTTSFQTGTQ
jgi:hypothetical protein